MRPPGRSAEPSPPKPTGAPAALAIAAHPDDIEFLMAGTLLLLRRAGWQTHYLNLASGNCGSMVHGPARTRVVRAKEARAAAHLLGARYHPALVDDLEIFYADALIRRVAGIIRLVQPTILLTHSLQDYMEDHTTTARVVVSAAFVRGMPNYRTAPARAPTGQETTVYHAMPHGLRDEMGRVILAGAYVNIGSVLAQKRAALAAHRSQKEWLDVTQGMESYLRSMEDMSRTMGRQSRRFTFAEGWRRHSHLGFCHSGADPLREVLRGNYLVNKQYERAMNRPRTAV